LSDQNFPLSLPVEDGYSKCNIVVFHIFDNNVFFAAGQDGSRTLPKRSTEDGKYHIPGKLELADHNVVNSLVNIAVPLLRAGGEAEKVILSPLPRYLKAHITNKRDKTYFAMMGESLADIKDSMKDLIFGKKN
jgi:hypothetical protein